MKVLVVGDFTTEPCGIRNFADQTFRALCNHPGLQVETWDGYYPEIYRRREAQEPGVYLPADAWRYDVIHVNWHPIAFNTYGPDHFPAPKVVSSGSHMHWWRKPILSVYLHDIPPHSGCPLQARANVVFAPEPSPGCVELPYPVADWIELPQSEPRFTVGCSTIRGDGVAIVAGVCAARNWTFQDRPAGWRTFEQEVQRMARNTVNVLWYHEERGKSGGLSQAISARRPIVCSDSPMFSHFWDYRDELYIAEKGDQDLTRLLGQVHQDWTRLTLRYPDRAAEERSWSYGTSRMVEAWEKARHP